MKLYFASGVLLTIAYAIQVINRDLNMRMRIIIPVMILFFITFFAFILEYERQRRTAWNKKEKRIIDDVYSKHIELYFEKKESEKHKQHTENEKQRQLMERKIKQGYSPLGNSSP